MYKAYEGIQKQRTDITKKEKQTGEYTEIPMLPEAERMKHKEDAKKFILSQLEQDPELAQIRGFREFLEAASQKGNDFLQELINIGLKFDKITDEKTGEKKLQPKLRNPVIEGIPGIKISNEMGKALVIGYKHADTFWKQMILIQSVYEYLGIDSVKMFGQVIETIKPETPKDANYDNAELVDFLSEVKELPKAKKEKTLSDLAKKWGKRAAVLLPLITILMAETTKEEVLPPSAPPTRIVEAMPAKAEIEKNLAVINAGSNLWETVRNYFVDQGEIISDRDILAALKKGVKVIDTDGSTKEVKIKSWDESVQDAKKEILDIAMNPGTKIDMRQF